MARTRSRERASERKENMRVQRNLFTGNMSSSDSEFHEPKEKGKTGDTIKVRQQQTRMSPLEREIMIEWLGMEREGQKEGQSMKNWRSIWGGAAKGRNMQGEVDEVHSSSGYSKLAAYVNTKCQIKTDKARAWNAEIAEKRWAWMKKQYKKAAKMSKPLNTHYEDDESFEAAMQKHEAAQEKACPGFKSLYTLLEGHPAVEPYCPTDSMLPRTPNSKSYGSVEDEDDDSQSAAPPMLRKEDTQGVIKKTKETTTAAARKKQKTEFSLRKPGNESASTKRLNIQEMFIKSQETQLEVDREKIKVDKQKLLVQAVTDLARAGIAPQDMDAYLVLMGLQPPKDPHRASDDEN
jgi:hypothetical protein